MKSVIGLSLAIVVLGLTGADARCSDGWVYNEGICYWVSADTLTWINAWTMCASYQSRLVEMAEQDKNSFLSRELNRNGETRCASGWEYYEDLCYWYSSDELTWIEASTMCRSFNARLIEIDDTDKNSLVSRGISKRGGGEWWIGLTDVESDGYWKWSNTRRKASYTLTSWDSGEPNGRTEENCGTANDKGRWNDRRCGDHQKYICQGYAS